MINCTLAGEKLSVNQNAALEDKNEFEKIIRTEQLPKEEWKKSQLLLAQTPLIVIGQSKDPRFLNGVSTKNFSLSYYDKKAAGYMTLFLKNGSS